MNRYQKYVLAYGAVATVLSLWLALTDERFDEGPPRYLLAGVVIALGTAALVAAGRRVRLGRGPLIGVGAGALVATGLSYVVVDTYACCMFSYHLQRGFPLPWWSANLVTDKYVAPSQIVEFMSLHSNDVSTSLRPLDLLLSVAVWSYAFALLVMIIGLVRSLPTLTGNRAVA